MKKTYFILFILFCISKFGVAQSWQALCDSATTYWGEDWEKTSKFLADAERITKINFEKNKQTDTSYCTVVANIAINEFEQGNLGEAKKRFIEQIDIYTLQKKDKSSDYASALIGLATVNFTEGDFLFSEQNFKKAQYVHEKYLNREHEFYANLMNNFAFLYKETGRPSEAETLFKKTISFLEYKKMTNTETYASVLNNLSLAYEDQRRFVEAEKVLTQSLSLQKELYGEKHINYLTSLVNLAILYNDNQKFAEAESIYVKTIQTYKAQFGVSSYKYAVFLSNLAYTYVLQKKYTLAQPLYEQSLAIYQKVFPKINLTYCLTLTSIAYIYEKTQKTAEAANLYNQVSTYNLQLIHDYFPILSEDEKVALVKKCRLPIEQSKQFYLQHSDIKDALSMVYDCQIATKGILLNDAIRTRRTILNNMDDNTKALYEKWVHQKELLVKYNQASQAQLQQQKINLDSLEKQTHVLEKEIAEKSLAFNIQQKESSSWKDIQKKLKPNEVALEMIQVKDTQNNDSVFYAALWISSKTIQPQVIMLPKGRYLEKEALVNYKRSIKNKFYDTLSYRVFWEPIAQQLPKQTKTVYFSPDGVYNQINLATLRNPKTGKFLLQSIDLQVVTNTKNLLLPKSEQKKVKEYSVVLFGYPDFFGGQNNNPKDNERGELLEDLPGTKKEIESIYNIISKRGISPKLYMQADACEDSIKKVDSPTILHIATHGFFNTKTNSSEYLNLYTAKKFNPMLSSGLILSKGAPTILNASQFLDAKKEDGVLTADEASRLSLENTEIVCLSACETGLGEVKAGEGVFGLQRAFKVAGAKTIIMSLWKVSDEATQMLMTDFYDNWITHNMTKKEAFLKAQMSIQKIHPEPYYWGAFMMIE